MLRGATESGRTSLDQIDRRSSEVSGSGELGGRKITLGKVLGVVARVLAAIVTVGLSEVGIALYKRFARHEPAPPGSNRAHAALETEGTSGTRRTRQDEGSASPKFSGAVERAINNAVQHDFEREFREVPEGSDERVVKHFGGGFVHDSFHADSDRSTYTLEGTKLEKDKETVGKAFRSQLSDEELMAATAILHQGIFADLFLELANPEGEGFLPGVPGGPRDADKRRGIEGSNTSFSLTCGEPDETGHRELHVTLENRMSVDSLMHPPEPSWFDPSQSFVHTKLTGVIRPGQDPVFQLTQPIDYSYRLVPGTKPD